MTRNVKKTYEIKAKVVTRFLRGSEGRRLEKCVRKRKTLMVLC